MINELVCKMLWLKREEKVANQRASLEVPGCLLPTAMCSPGDTHEMSVRGEQKSQSRVQEGTKNLKFVLK